MEDICARDNCGLDERWHEMLKRDPQEFEEWVKSLPEVELFTPEIMEAQRK
jgi:hypothetical protein